MQTPPPCAFSGTRVGGFRQGPQLLRALRKNCLEAVQQTIEDDIAAIYELIPGEFGGFEPVVVAAMQYGCSDAVLELLIRSGALVNDTGSCGLSPLAFLASGQGGESKATVSIPGRPGPADWMTPGGLHHTEFSAMSPLSELLGGLWEIPPHMASSDACIVMPGASLATWEKEGCRVAAALLYAGADLSWQDASGQKVADLAEASHQYKLADFLNNWQDSKECSFIKAIGPALAASKRLQPLAIRAL
eukprot:CAMPEP_0170608758 /NCGR_PEP_ID=MMETSP0224-20130122/21756_1 /TAXON_ID=285029 /ORGANISM="Togula jolla, Strain CCCM 725" /LENGTH=246 /DNA_ID=CAMNT_0010934007 /DNA_START=26 /DNA_END=767 /DNA_ORIENTATION=+